MCPLETPLLRAARERGLKAANGSEMLIAQAAIAFERWTGVGGMAEVMRAAVAPLLADTDGRRPALGCAWSVPRELGRDPSRPSASETTDGPGAAARPDRTRPGLIYDGKSAERPRARPRRARTIAWDRALTANVDAEVELGVVIGTLAWTSRRTRRRAMSSATRS